ncbi:MAG: efflux RND transporter periplasmic adaptor subunit [Pseudomonadota bacterium]
MITTDSYPLQRRISFLARLLIIGLVIACPLAARSRAADPPPKSAVIAHGKFFCPVQARVIMPFEGTVLSLASEPGQPVRKGDLIFPYRLDAQEALSLHHRFAQFHIGELEISLLDLDDALTELHLQEEELESLHRQQLAPQRGLKNITRKIQLMSRKKQILQRRLQEERDLEREERRNAGMALGLAHEMGQVPADAFLKAPMEGHIIWLNPELREGARIAKNTPLIQIGIMDPMVVRAQVHEIEAAKIRPGDSAEVGIESIPGRVFQATVQRIPWAPLPTALTQPTYYEVELSVSNPDLLIKEGFKAQVTFLSSRKDPLK